MLDLIKLTLQAGNGGNGRVSFRREKYVPKGGPDGGDGGDGGSIILKGNKNLSTLANFGGKKVIEAKSGLAGGKRKKKGEDGEDLIIELPLGTIVWEVVRKGRRHKTEDSTPWRRCHGRQKPEVRRQPSYAKPASSADRASEGKKPEALSSRLEQSDMERSLSLEQYHLSKPGERVPAREAMPWVDLQGSELFSDDPKLKHSLKGIDYRKLEKRKLFEIESDNSEHVICQGGRGGKGNNAFKSAREQVPLRAEYGEFGEARVVILELKLLADIGLIGYPSAGKSTFLSVVSEARPEIADYPFTTLSPNLGVVSLQKSKIENRKSRNKRELVVADIPGLIEGASEGKGLGHEFLRHVERCRKLIFVLALSEETLFDASLSAQEKAARLLDQFKKLQKELENYHEDLVKKAFSIAVNKVDLFGPQDEELRKAIVEIFAKEKLKVQFMSNATGEGIVSILETRF